MRGYSALTHTRHCNPRVPGVPGSAKRRLFNRGRDLLTTCCAVRACARSLAAFLITRGPFAWFGYGWTGCADATHPFTRPKELEADYGVPQGFCEETKPGVFERKWSKADISINCNDFTADIKMTG